MITNDFINDIQILSENLRYNKVNQSAHDCFIDYLGCQIAGRKYLNEKVNKFFITKGESSSLISALQYGINAHVLELDDGHRIGMVHPGAPVISALLAIAEKQPVLSNDFFRGIVVGYDVAIRLACAIQPGHKLKGYHTTGTCGTVGAAMGIAAMLNFDFEQTKSAFSAATTSAAGILEMIDGDTQMKPYNAGRAAMDGVAAAYIGEARFKSPDDALGGKRGFLNVMTDEPKLQYITDFSQGAYMIESIYRKPYAACRHCHPAIEAALRLHELKGFDIEKIKQIHVSTYKLAVEGHDHTQIGGSNSAKMSIPYSLAVALCTGKAGMDEFTDEQIQDPRVLNVAKKVSVTANDELSALCPQKRVAIVIVETDKGEYVERVDYPKGEPENPLSPKELEEKFYGLAMYGGLTNAECDELIEEIGKNEFSINKIMTFVCKK